jgi:hypothetical protein
MRCDAIVIGSSLGGLVCATYLARSGLRVTLVEELCLTKRPPVLREPFALSGLGTDGFVRQVLKEVALPLLEQREIREEALPLQVILPEARIDVPSDRDALIDELAAHRLAERREIAEWLDRVDERAHAAMQLLFAEVSLRLSRPTRAAGPSRRLRSRPSAPRLRAPLPPPPAGLARYAWALIEALSGLVPGASQPAAAWLVSAAHDAACRMPHAGALFLDLFRRRFLSLQGEIASLDEFTLHPGRREVGIDLPRGSLLTEALVIAAPREPLRRFSQERGASPTWLRAAPEPVVAPPRIYRVKRSAFPTGMATRTIVAQTEETPLYWLARIPDPSSREFDWLVVGGLGVGMLPMDRPLGSLAPFSENSISAVDPGPPPRWDLSSSELLVVQPDPEACLRARPPVLLLGPEQAPGLGLEGEILHARRAAQLLVERFFR